MERPEYDKLDRLEERMWWFAALHANLLGSARAVGGLALRPLRVLDAGCGTGGFLAKLSAAVPEAKVVGLDADELACSRAAVKTARPIARGTVNALPFADGAFTAVFSADVLCHRDVDETQALAQFRRVLAPGGVLVLNLPAYRWLLSRHDRAVYNVRRYTRRRIERLLRGAGLRPVYSTYWNCMLFPLMVLTRKLLPGRGSGSDVRPYPAPVEALCRIATGVEHALICSGWRLPFGGSLIAVAGKPGGSEEIDA